jgi:hypothetical protein
MGSGSAGREVFGTPGGFECNGLWLLKNPFSLKIAEILGIENVYQNGDRRL